MAGQRFDIVVRTSSRRVRKQDVVFTRQPLRPGSVLDEFDDIVKSQYEHLGFGVKSPYLGSVTKYVVRGMRLRGAGIDVGTFGKSDVVLMWSPQTKACVVVKVVRHG